MKKTAILAGAMLIGGLSLASSGVSANETSTTTSNVSSISLSVIDGPYVSWTTVGSSSKGYKVVWSKNTGPTYPTRDGDMYHYLSDASASKDKLEPFSGVGTYYVRVCEYLGGACGTYSNEVSVSLAAMPMMKDDGKKGMMRDDQGDNGDMMKGDDRSPSKEMEKIPSLDVISSYTNIKKIGNDLYGVKIDSILAKSKKERITKLEDVRLFKDIEKIGDSLYGIRMVDGRKMALQNKLNMLNDQMKRLQSQIDEINKQLSSLQ